MGAMGGVFLLMGGAYPLLFFACWGAQRTSIRGYATPLYVSSADGYPHPPLPPFPSGRGEKFGAAALRPLKGASPLKTTVKGLCDLRQYFGRGWNYSPHKGLCALFNLNGFRLLSTHPRPLPHREGVYIAPMWAKVGSRPVKGLCAPLLFPSPVSHSPTIPLVNIHKSHLLNLCKIPPLKQGNITAIIVIKVIVFRCGIVFIFGGK